MSKRPIPALLTPDPQLSEFAGAVKQNLDGITGQTRTSEKLTPLPATATTAEVVALLNKIVERLQ